MKLLSFTTPLGVASYGVLAGSGVVDLGARLAAPGLRDLLAVPGWQALAAALLGHAADYQLAEISLAPVIPNPDKIICVGLNYHAHVTETGRSVTEKPLLFARFAGSQVGAGQALVRPLISHEFDYEGELAVIIGRGGRHIAPEDALDAVAGYACYNDGSVRDWQRHTSQFLPGKTFAGTGAFGPYLVTADEVGDPTALTLETRLNGQVVQHTTTDLMITGITALIAYCSAILPLLPGDVLVTGTPGGVGAKRTPPLWMKAGDVVEVEISRVGLLRNSVVDEVG
jgi:2-keto-4-pentenoate hydratase/2-oxohepta-3-ene-1,7-dioic acid hydratase in catechol pathway